MMENRNMTDVVAALIWDCGRFMICQRPAHKARGLLWEFVGGKVEPGETKVQALIRECQEELAVTVMVNEVFMEVIHEYPDITVHLTLFNASIAEGVPQKLEHNDIHWITPEEIPQYPFCPADEEILKRIRIQSPQVKKGQLCHAQALAALALKLWPDHTGEELKEEITALLSCENVSFFLAYVNDMAVGFAQCQLRHDYVEGTDSSPVGYLEGIFVIEGFRKKGIASKLLTACQQWAKAKGCREFASDCELNNLKSLQFHQKTGFQEANRIICFTKKL